jgi:DNA-directed RNA polymerase beta' subunit
VYPNTVVETDSKIPEHVPLDSNFGFFVGAYIARGRVKDNVITISEVDDANFNKIKQFVDMYNIAYTFKPSCNTLSVQCSVLAGLLQAFDNSLPAELIAAPTQFLKELISGCVYGRGILSTDRSAINLTLDSMSMLETVQQILLRFGTRTTMVTNRVDNSCFGFKRGCESHTLHIPYTMFGDDKTPDVVPNVKLSTMAFETIPRNDIPGILSRITDPDDIAVLQRTLDEDIVYDEVISIEEVKNGHPHVYDLTVEGTRNFNTYTGICMADTFHSAGISSASKAVRGVPRLQELLNVTKKIKTPIMTIHVKPHFRTESTSKEEYKTKCLNILNELSTTRFKNIVTKSQIHYDPNDFDSKIEEDKRFIEMYRMFNDVTEQNIKASPWLLRFEFDRQNMINIGINMIDLQNVLQGFYDDRVSCMFSDDNSSNLVMRVKLTTDSVDSGEDMLAEIKALQHNIMENVIIKGIQGIEKISMRDQKSQHYGYDKNTQTFVHVNEWIMDTDGSNLRDVMNSKYVDPYLTTTNNIFEIYEVLGIEAVRKALYNEIIEVLSGIDVNYRHISLLIDTMANKGSIMPINRHGINRGDAGPLAKCSFEEVTDMLVSAGVFSDFDKINGVSANVMLGQIPASGTGDGDIIMDEEILMKIIGQYSMKNKDKDNNADDGDSGQCDFKINMHVPTGLKTNDVSKDLDISFI